MIETDYKKLLEQEPDFRMYAQDALMAALAVTSLGRQTLQQLHTFYQIGMSEEMVIKFLTLMLRENGGE
jgi:hypothetical protein